MVLYKKILLSHAGTEAGDDALKHAIHVAAPSYSEILILHVVERYLYPSMFGLNTSDKESFIKEIDEVTEMVKKHMTNEMQKRVQKCKEEGITAKYEMVVGYPASEIISAIQKYKIDLVVMAKKRKFSENKILNLGDVTRKVLEKANCPILIIDSENKQQN